MFAAINELKLELRRAGEDVVDLGFGNPDLPSPEIAVEKLREAVLNPRNHRYSASRGIPNLRRAICDLYERRFGVTLDPETQALTTIGAKEGLAHLMWVLVEPGDAALVPAPELPDPPVRACVRGGGRRAGADGAGRGSVRERRRSLRALAAETARARRCRFRTTRRRRSSTRTSCSGSSISPGSGS